MSMLYSLKRLSSFRLIVPADAANNFVMDARLALSPASTMLRPDSGVALEAPGRPTSLDENVTLIDDEDELSLLLLPPAPGGGRWPDEGAASGADEIVSSKELNLVRFMIQPSILRSSLSSVTFCQETFSVVDETASTMTSSGWPGRSLTPSATPLCLRVVDCGVDCGVGVGVGVGRDALDCSTRGGGGQSWRKPVSGASGGGREGRRLSIQSKGPRFEAHKSSIASMVMMIFRMETIRLVAGAQVDSFVRSLDKRASQAFQLISWPPAGAASVCE